jgi:hypothetical protein
MVLKKVVNDVEMDMTPAEEAEFLSAQMLTTQFFEEMQELSRRQFFMQLEIAGLTTQVRDYIASKSVLEQIAFNESGSFRRGDQMLVDGFTALGFTKQQIDDFWRAASEL